MNEGFTSFIEAKILGHLDPIHGEQTRKFHAAQQWQELKNAVETWGLTHPYTCLVYRLNNIDHDDAYSSGSISLSFCFLFDLIRFRLSSILQRCGVTLAFGTKYRWFSNEIRRISSFVHFEIRSTYFKHR